MGWHTEEYILEWIQVVDKNNLFGTLVEWACVCGCVWVQVSREHRR